MPEIARGARGRQMVCQRSRRKRSSLREIDRAGERAAAVRFGEQDPGDGARRGLRIRGRLRAGAGGIALSLARMNRIKEINFADAVAVVEPGVITASCRRRRGRRSLFYPPDPASLKDCSLGGNVATNAGGPRCLKYGVTRNYVIGLEVVLASGEVLRTGGRVHKNKTGFDLIGLFVGSEGMLGVVTEITLKLLPLPPARATLSAAFRHDVAAAAAVQEIFAAGFSAVFARDRRSFHAGGGAARSRERLVSPGNAHLLVDLDGQPETVRVEMAKLRALVARKRPNASRRSRRRKTECERLWSLAARVQQFAARHRADEAEPGYRGAAEPPRRSGGVRRSAAAKSTASRSRAFGHAGDGNIHVNIMAERYNRDAAVREKVEARAG